MIHKNMNFMMTVAFVLLNCDIGSEKETIEQLKQFKKVKEVHGIFGAYDILAKLEARSHEDINTELSTKIRKLENVNATMTLFTIGS